MAKPKFNPNAAFEAVEEQPKAKPKFNPNAAFEAADVANKPQETPGLIDSASRGLAQGASLGFADELSGRAGQLAGLLGLVPNKGYEYYRDYARNKDTESSKANPKAFMAGELGGGAATMVIPGLTLGKGMKGAAASGLLQGGITGAGQTKEDLLTSAGAKDVAVSAAMGGAGGAAGGLLGRFFTGAAPTTQAVKETAESLASRALGAERGSIKKIGLDKVLEAGRYALDEGIVSPLSTASKMASRNEAARIASGQAQEGVYQALENAGLKSFKPLDAAVEIEGKIGNFWRSPINRGETNQLENTLESVLMRGEKPISFTEAQSLKKELGKVANWKNTLNPTDKELMARDAYGVIASAIDKTAEEGSKVVGGNLDKVLRKANKGYSSTKVIDQLLENKLAREQGNKLFGLTDSIAGGAGLAASAATGGLSAVPAVTLIGIKKIAEKFGPQAAAVALDNVSKGMRVVNTAIGPMAAPIAAGAEAIGRQTPSIWEQMKK